MGDVVKWTQKLIGGDLKTQYTDSRIDRMNHVWTVAQLCFFAILVVSKQFVGQPIKCWHPAEFKGFWIQYAESYCWIKNTYHIPMNEIIPVEHDEREKSELNYYQWVFIILLFIAMLFKLPNVLWNRFNDYGGLHIDKIIRMAADIHWAKPDKRAEKVKTITYYFQRWFEAYSPKKLNAWDKVKEKLGDLFCFPFAKRTGNYLTGLYLFIKILYVCVSIAVFYILNMFLHSDYSLYGFDVIDQLSNDGEVRDLHVFPRVTMCDFDIRQLNNIQRFSVQCVLSINLYTEKMFIFLWFWFFLMAIVNAIDLIKALYIYGLNKYGDDFVKKHLIVRDCLHTFADKEKCQKLRGQLKRDGLFVLRMIERNSSPILVADIIEDLYKDL